MPQRIAHVLLIEDNDVDIEGVRRAFRKRSIANPLVVARDGKAGLDLLRSGAIPRPFVILLDLNLPRMTGIEFLDALRDDLHLHDSVVFVLTTSKRAEDMVAAYQLNVAGYIVKSDAGEGFSNLAEMLKSYWRVVELPR